MSTGRPSATVADIVRLLASMPQDARLVVWLPGSHIDLCVGVMHRVTTGEVLIEGNVRPGSALDRSE
jgi:hypothetical protein